MRQRQQRSHAEHAATHGARQRWAGLEGRRCGLGEAEERRLVPPPAGSEGSGISRRLSWRLALALEAVAGHQMAQSPPVSWECQAAKSLEQPLGAAARHLLPLRCLRRLRLRLRLCRSRLPPRERRRRACARARAAPALPLARMAPQQPHRPCAACATLAEPPLLRRKLRRAPPTGSIVVVDPAVLAIALVIPRPRRATACRSVVASRRVELLLVPPLAPPLPPAAGGARHRGWPGGAERPPRARHRRQPTLAISRDLRDLI
eukprot:scaffold17731_cov45-Phaeocystis_antarctica.AAC.1